MVQLIIFLLVIATAATSVVGGAFSSVTTTTAGVGRRVEAGAELLAVAQKIEQGVSPSGMQEGTRAMTIADVSARQAATSTCGRSALNITADLCPNSVSPVTGGGVVSSTMSGQTLPVVDMSFNSSALPWARLLGGACEQITAGASAASKCSGAVMVVVPKAVMTADDQRRLDSALRRLRAAGVSCSTALTQELELGSGAATLWSTPVALPASGTLTCKVRA